MDTEIKRLRNLVERQEMELIAFKLTELLQSIRKTQKGVKGLSDFCKHSDYFHLARIGLNPLGNFQNMIDDLEVWGNEIMQDIEKLRFDAENDLFN